LYREWNEGKSALLAAVPPDGVDWIAALGRAKMRSTMASAISLCVLTAVPCALPVSRHTVRSHAA
jgi:hypothetical protein